MGNAEIKSCDILYRPKDEKYAENIRKFQGCPTIAISPRGRIFVAWYAGGTREPHIENYNILVYSDDDGKNWSEPLLIIPSSKEMLVHALDIQLFTDNDGKLHVYWVQNNVKPEPDVLPKTRPDQPLVAVEGYLFDDFRHSMWEIICENPDDENPLFSEPQRLDMGFLRCKPTILSNGDWLFFNYDQIDSRYAYAISSDGGKTLHRHYAGEKLSTVFDETMAYQKENGEIRVFARTSLGEIAEFSSFDNAKSFTEARLSRIVGANTRFYVSRTPSGKILLVKNDDREKRINMTACLSDDDGETWKYSLTVDPRVTSYPDVDFYNGRIYLVYDRERIGEREILFMSFTEEDIISGTSQPLMSIISKP